MYISKPNTKLKKLQQKLKKKVYSLDLISGWSCPFAKKCKSKVHQINGRRKVIDHKNIWFRCFSASQEALFSHVYKRRIENYLLAKKYHSRPIKLAKVIQDNLPSDIEVLRWHVAGDFFSRNYFLSAIKLANQNPNIIFYAYTKSVKYYLELKELIPDNFRITISIGGTQDHLIDKNMRTARVINKKEEQKIWNLDIDEDDSHAYYNANDFLLLIHGIQPKVEIIS